MSGKFVKEGAKEYHFFADRGLLIGSESVIFFWNWVTRDLKLSAYFGIL
jgi:hypothetical protein